jgi:ribonuclease VapC
MLQMVAGCAPGCCRASPGRQQLIQLRLLSAASLVEASIVIESHYGEAGGRELDLLVREADMEVIAVSPEQAELAWAAYRRFGGGRHPAGLNFGDCSSFVSYRILGVWITVY